MDPWIHLLFFGETSLTPDETGYIHPTCVLAVAVLHSLRPGMCCYKKEVSYMHVFLTMLLQAVWQQNPMRLDRSMVSLISSPKSTNP